MCSKIPFWEEISGDGKTIPKTLFSIKGISGCLGGEGTSAVDRGTCKDSPYNPTHSELSLRNFVPPQIKNTRVEPEEVIG